MPHTPALSAPQRERGLDLKRDRAQMEAAARHARPQARGSKKHLPASGGDLQENHDTCSKKIQARRTPRLRERDLTRAQPVARTADSAPEWKLAHGPSDSSGAAFCLAWAYALGRLCLRWLPAALGSRLRHRRRAREFDRLRPALRRAGRAPAFLSEPARCPSARLVPARPRTERAARRACAALRAHCVRSHPGGVRHALFRACAGAGDPVGRHRLITWDSPPNTRARASFRIAWDSSRWCRRAWKCCSRWHSPSAGIRRPSWCTSDFCWPPCRCCCASAAGCG